jgi:glycosyltransferase involved in cell wall biosynthesis
MQITFVCAPPNLSGGNRVIAIYAEYLKKFGHNVRLVYPRQRTQSIRPIIREFLKALGRSRTSNPGSQNKITSHFEQIDVDKIEVDREGYLTETDIPDADVVIATWWETAEWLNQCSPAKGRKFYFIQHHELFEYVPISRVRATYRMPLVKIVIAKWLSDVMQQEYDDRTSILVPNAVDHQQFNAQRRTKQVRPTIGMLFNKTPFKGMDIAFAIINKLQAELPNLRIISFGADAPTADISLPINTELIVAPAQQSIRELYAQCDVWLTTSRSEGFNLPAMEAMACRTPVVSTRTGWPAEAIVDGHNGYLGAVDAVDELTNAARKILTLSPEQWQDMSDHAYATVESSNWENSARMFEHALQFGIKNSTN